MADDPTVALWAEDECFFKMHGSLVRMRAPKGESPIQIFAPTLKKLGYFGAVGLEMGELEFQRADSLNAQTFKDFLNRFIRNPFSPGRKVIMILDNARWHHAKMLNDFLEIHRDKIELLFLPPICWNVIHRSGCGNSADARLHIISTSKMNRIWRLLWKANFSAGIALMMSYGIYVQLNMSFKIE